MTLRHCEDDRASANAHSTAFLAEVPSVFFYAPLFFGPRPRPLVRASEPIGPSQLLELKTGCTVFTMALVLSGVWGDIVAYLDLRSVTRLWLSGDSSLHRHLYTNVLSILPSAIYSPFQRRLPTQPSVVPRFSHLLTLIYTFHPHYRRYPLPSTSLSDGFSRLVTLSVPRLCEGLVLDTSLPSLKRLSVTRSLRTDLDWVTHLPLSLESLDLCLETTNVTLWCARLPRSLSRLHIVLVRTRERVAPSLDTRILPPCLTYLSIWEQSASEWVPAAPEAAWQETWPSSGSEATTPLRAPSLPPLISSSPLTHHHHPTPPSNSPSADPAYRHLLGASNGSHLPILPPELAHLTLHISPTRDLGELLSSLPNSITSLDLGPSPILFERAPRLVAQRRSSDANTDDSGLTSPDMSCTSLLPATSVSSSISDSSSPLWDMSVQDALSAISGASSASHQSASFAQPLLMRQRSRSSTAHMSSPRSHSFGSEPSISNSMPDGAPFSSPLFSKSPLPPSPPNCASAPGTASMWHAPLSASSSFSVRPRSHSSLGTKSPRFHFGSRSSSERSSSSSHSAPLRKCLPNASIGTSRDADQTLQFGDALGQVAAHPTSMAFFSHASFSAMDIGEEETASHSTEGLHQALKMEFSDGVSSAHKATTSTSGSQTMSITIEEHIPLVEQDHVAIRPSGRQRFEVNNLPRDLVELHGQLSHLYPNALRDLPYTLRVLTIPPESANGDLKDEDLEGLPRTLQVLHLHLLRASQMRLLPRGLTHLTSGLSQFDIPSHMQTSEWIPFNLERWNGSPRKGPPSLPPPSPTVTAYVSIGSFHQFSSHSSSFYSHQSRSGSTSLLTTGRDNHSMSMVRSSTYSSISSTMTDESAMVQETGLEDDRSKEGARRRRQRSEVFSSRAPFAAPMRPHTVASTDPSDEVSAHRLPSTLTELDCSVEDLRSLANLPPRLKNLSLDIEGNALGSYPHLSANAPAKNFAESFGGGPETQKSSNLKFRPLHLYLPETLTSLSLTIKQAALINSLLLAPEIQPAPHTPSFEIETQMAPSQPSSRLSSLESLKISCKEELKPEDLRCLKAFDDRLLKLDIEFGLPIPFKREVSGTLFSRSSSPVSFTRSESYPTTIIPSLTPKLEVKQPRWPFGSYLPSQLQTLIVRLSGANFEQLPIEILKEEMDALPESIVYLSIPKPCGPQASQVLRVLDQLSDEGLEYHFN